MILPIYAYGHPVLKKVCQEITSEFEDLDLLIENMWETMYHASGIGLAAPQIGKNIRIFIVDTLQLENEEKELVGIKKIFINAVITKEEGEEESFEEGCLSIPDVRGDVMRKPIITIAYQDEKFEKHEDTYEGINARVIQHEYDHIEGRLFTELLQPLRKRRVKRKLESIKKGNVNADYRMRFVIK